MAGSHDFFSGGKEGALGIRIKKGSLEPVYRNIFTYLAEGSGGPITALLAGGLARPTRYKAGKLSLAVASHSTREHRDIPSGGTKNNGRMCTKQKNAALVERC